MDWDTHKIQLLKNPRFKKAVGKNRLEYEIARAVILARIKYKFSQKQLAKKLNTQQSVISRLETAQTTPSLSFLQRLAGVFNGRVNVSFEGF